MAPKRKAPSDDLDTSPSKRVTRSRNSQLETQPLSTRSRTGTPQKPSRKAAQASPTKTPKPRAAPKVRAVSPVQKEKEESSDDELNLSPSKTRSHRTAPRVFVDAVEPSTPSSSRLSKSTPSTSLQAVSEDEHIQSPKQIISVSTPTKALAKDRFPLPQTKSLSPIKSAGGNATPHLPTTLPSHLHSCLNAQKRAIFAALQDAPDFIAREDADEGPLPNTVASQQLDALLAGTITRDEGNSCLILGPRGSGKTRVSSFLFKEVAMLSD